MHALVEQQPPGRGGIGSAGAHGPGHELGHALRGGYPRPALAQALDETADGDGAAHLGDPLEPIGGAPRIGGKVAPLAIDVVQGPGRALVAGLDRALEKRQAARYIRLAQHAPQVEEGQVRRGFMAAELRRLGERRESPPREPRPLVTT